MRKTLIYSLLITSLMMLYSCGSHKTSAYGDIESTVVETTYDGVYVVLSRGRAPKKDVLEVARYNAMDAAKKRAVYDVVFKILNTHNLEQKILNPILMEVNAEQKYAKYFTRFFANDGEWQHFVSQSGSRIKATHFSKTTNEMVVDMYVYVDRNALTEKLIEDKILK